MQARPAGHQTTHNLPTTPQIPLQHIQNLIPRLTTTINDIDSLKALLAHGAQDGTMPNWDLTLQRYSLLLGRLSSLSTYLSQPTPTALPTSSAEVRNAARLASSSTSTSVSSIPPGSTIPALDKYIVHPLIPLPDPLPDTLNPIAPDTFFQVLNTLPLPSLSTAQDELLSPNLNHAHLGEPGPGPSTSTSTRWASKAELKKMDEGTLHRLERNLRGRLQRESKRARAITEEIDKQAEEVDWVMRVGEEEEGEEEGGEVGDEGDDEDLFGDEDDEDQGDKRGKVKGQKEEEEVKLPNPREGWSIGDYVTFMDTGKEPGG